MELYVVRIIGWEDTWDGEPIDNGCVMGVYQSTTLADIALEAAQDEFSGDVVVDGPFTLDAAPL